MSESGFAGRKDEQDFKKFSVEVRVSLRVRPSLNENNNPENSKTGGILIRNWLENSDKEFVFVSQWRCIITNIHFLII